MPGARGTSLPGDWDGGWRRTSPPTLTVARAPLGVSDGLTFRAGLASWQNPSFDAGLGHAVLPSAPVGLVHGVTGPPATGATYADGGPLLLRALRTDAGEGEGSSSVAEPGAAAAVRTPTLRARTAPAAAPNRGDDKGSGTADRPRTSVPSGTAGPDRTGQTPAGDAPSVQRSVAAPAPGRALVASDPLVPTAAPTAQVQRTERPGAASDAGVVRPDDPARPAPVPEIPVVRRIAVVPDASGAPAVRRTAPEAAHPASRERAANTPVRPTVPGPPLTVARRVAAPVRRITGLRPTARPAEASTPPAARTDATPASAPGESPASTPAGPTSAVQRAVTPARPGSRPPLGEPMRELPSSAGPLAADATGTTRPVDDAHPTTGPALPIIQRQTDAPAPGPTPATQHTAAPARAGSRPPLGEPTTRPANDAHPTTGPALPIIQRQTDAPAPGPTPATQHAAAPARAGGRAPLGEPMAELPSTARPLSDGVTSTTRPVGDTHPTAGPALPIIQRQTDAPAPEPSRQSTPPRPSDARQDATGSSGVRARGGLGAPLPSMPATADVPRSAYPARQPRTSAGPGTPHVQRTPAHAERPASGPHAGTAALLGTTDSVNREVDSPVSAPSLANSAPTPATPLVIPGGPRSAPSATPEPVTGTGTVQRVPAPETGTASASRAVTSSRSRSGGITPVVVARAVASSAPLTARTSTTPHGPAQRSLSLLAARPLTVNTRVPDGVAPPAASTGASRRPVVAASWRREPSRAQAPAPTPTPTPTPTPQLQRSVGSSTGPTASYNTPSHESGSARPRRAVPVVRPVPPVQRTAPLHPQALPVTDPQAAPVRDRPASPEPRPGPPVPVVRATRTTNGVPTGTPTGAGPVPPGVPVTSVPARAVQRTPAAGPVAGRVTGTHPPRSAEAAQDPGIDLDELARRLLEPMARLLRADLRRGRERAGRPYDGRR
ncbi:hypothetical protein [Streptomyces sp. MUSC 14]|uniref:hypothetical protein n=1 Tax=Streptomyces sp. MUSC 14 TaxID=1354889 RepID=UPI0011607109|nr:hypothetical protein [Streptomyces sp. MUSC 14]